MCSCTGGQLICGWCNRTQRFSLIILLGLYWVGGFPVVLPPVAEFVARRIELNRESFGVIESSLSQIAQMEGGCTRLIIRLQNGVAMHTGYIASTLNAVGNRSGWVGGVRKQMNQKTFRNSGLKTENHAYSEGQNCSTKGQISLVSQIVAQRTKGNLWENRMTRAGILYFVMPNDRHLASFVDFILTLQWDQCSGTVLSLPLYTHGSHD